MLLSSVFFTALHAQGASAGTPAFAVTTTNVLWRIDLTGSSDAPIGTITGLPPGEVILAIDVRPLDGALYGVSATHLYAIDRYTAQATAVAPNGFPVPLDGEVGMDFDPVFDRITLTTNTQHLRVNLVDGTVSPEEDGVTIGSSVAGVAYRSDFEHNRDSRNHLYAIDVAADRLLYFSPLPSGPIGPLGFDATGVLGFDIGLADDAAWAVMAGAADTQSTLFTIDLATGAAKSIRPIAAGVRMRALAVYSLPVTVYGLTVRNEVFTFHSSLVSQRLPQPQGLVRPITGLAAGEIVLAIDIRPADGALYGVTSARRLVVINPLSGLVTSILPLQAGVGVGTPVGLDFDPIGDRARIVTDTGQNLSVSPISGAVIVETPLDIPGTVAVAYALTNGGAAATLYGLDQQSDRLVRFSTPSTGAGTLLTPIGVDVGPLAAFDVAEATGGSLGFAALDGPLPGGTSLYVISLPDGAVRRLAYLVGGDLIRGLAAAPAGRLAFSADDFRVLENAGAASITVVRTGGSEGPATVRLSAQPQTASAADFTPRTFTVQFARGETSRTSLVPITDDTAIEGAEDVLLTLSDPAGGATLVEPVATTLTIVDNDPVSGGTAPAIEITPSPVSLASSLFVDLAGTATDADGHIVSVTWASDKGSSGTAIMGPPGASVAWSVGDIQLAAGANTITVVATDDQGNQATDTAVVTLDRLSYYLAEGAKGQFFDTDLLLVNPHASSIEVAVAFLSHQAPFGYQSFVEYYVLPPTSRTTLALDTAFAIGGPEFSLVVTVPVSQPIVVERTMRWDATGYGAHTEKASSGVSRTWYFAEGSQGFFHTYLLLMNPEQSANTAVVRYLREGAPPVVRTYPMRPFERITVDAGAEPALVHTSFGIEVTFALPGAAERAMYFGDNPLWVGGHETAGIQSPSLTWFLAEGATGPFFETFLLLANPNASDATVDVRYFPAGQTSIQRTYTVKANARLTVNIEQQDVALLNAAVASQVTSTLPILVERAQYWPDPAVAWYESHASFGTKELSAHWGLAEGRVGGPNAYETYILLVNPGNQDTTVAIDFLRENGAPVRKTFLVPTEGRVNVQVGVDVPELADESFGATIRSLTMPIAVERSMYSSALGQVWQAGTNATGTRLPPP
jgi:hypothetical protein